MTEEELYAMKLHDLVSLDHHSVLRVIGGWIYDSHTHTGAISSTFVPEPQEIITHEHKPTVAGFFERRHHHE